jgi:hypothetical protein
MTTLMEMVIYGIHEIGTQQTVDSRQQTEGGRQQAAGSRQQAAGSRQFTVDKYRGEST